MLHFNAVSGFAKLIKLSVLIYLCTHISAVLAEDYFSPDFIETRGNISRYIDISRFSKTDGQIPGIYRVNVYLNGNYIESRDISFVGKESALAPALTPADFVKWGVKRNAQPDWMDMAETATIENISELLPGSQLNFQFDDMRLVLSVPQEYMQHDPQGAVSPEQWDDGLNMLFMNYNFSAANSHSHGESRNDSYLNLRSGINVGPWRLRNYSTYNNNDGAGRWNSIGTSLERNIKTLKSQFSMGDGYTQSGVFDSVNFRGAQLYSDDSMLPESVRGFAPVVRGIAQSNAQVTVRQGGNIVWQSYVPPGPFVIDDLYPTAASGDLEVAVREADGSVHQFIQSFSAVPVMQREGQFKYALAAGKYLASNRKDKAPEFLQATMSYGLPWDTTVYGGTLASGDYQAGTLGIGKGFGDYGSLSFDTTFAHTRMPGKTEEGISLRAQYAKDFASTGTSMSLMGYRYSSSGFRDFQEANGDVNKFRIGGDNVLEGNQWRYERNKRSKAQVILNQRLGDWGNLNLSAWQQDYWGGDTERSVNVGYNTSINNINYGLNYSYSGGPWHNENDHIISITVQIPFSRFLPDSWMTVSANINKKGDATSQVGLSGSALEDKNLSWNVQQGYNSKGSDVMGSSSANYKGRHGEYQLGYNYSRDNRQVSVGAMGGVVVHPYGISTTQPLGETIALVKADNAADVKVANNSGIYTDSKGFAVVPYVTPYRQNSLSLDTASLNKNTDVLSDTRTVVPTKGALALADYPTVTGYKIMLQLTGKAIPFGATARIKNHDNVPEGIVDDRNRVWLNGALEKGTVEVNWSGGGCQATYLLARASDKPQNVSAQCH
ncbi:TPA: fimbrial biogenesis outer membrane usher protein [Klebsiella pneumoniae]|uniref:fimbria/pilus outer membrane usher protein n=1 Tax=Klebsiella pneumoniae TaxID=573 RepID=UPI001FAED229|nr:fimbria/pilus outer membrane usher protein [Klebsiella pneumoniae]UOB87174.1 fimbrial biogenesis outer membrane usher protein [Klebsiella pneumoniae]HBR6925111.1 fimbrial biogenesis outer membrane usher protein [Klebsiella pneumoniae]HBW1100390.1 fimbrial biogenesis outer membrane usher protein [Klebsiella pneumoniae]